MACRTKFERPPIKADLQRLSSTEGSICLTGILVAAG